MERKVELDLDSLYRLMAALMKRALMDARRGDGQARRWLDEFMSDWRRFV